MSKVRAVLAGLAILVVLGTARCSSQAASSAGAGRAGLAACNAPGMPADALCGTHEVFQNRVARTGRKIPLRIVVLPATGSDPLPDPFVYFAGGPGESSIASGVGMAQQLAALREQRDVLLVDYRGTGQSGGLFCAELKDAADPQGFLDDFLPTTSAHACRDRLMKEVDLSWYTTDAAVDDVEEVRTHLGYGPLNLMGDSYGTRAVLTYLRRHPKSVRTATMDGIVPPDTRYLLDMARASQQALDGLLAECAGGPACRAAFPSLRQEVDAVLRRAGTEPVEVTVMDLAGGRPLSLRLTSSAVAQTLRYMLYSPAESALLPLQVHQAAQGEWKPLARSAVLHAREMGEMAEGYFQSVSCAEEVARIGEEEIDAAVAGTFLGDFRIRRQQAACEGWPVRALGADVHAPVVSDVPALLISGERDPVTPPSYGERAAGTLKNARRLVIADGCHSLIGMRGGECVLAMIAAFIQSGTTQGLDVACVAGLRRPDFELPEVAVAKTDLEILEGSYAAKESPVAVKVAFAGDRLRLAVTEGPPLRGLLIPTSRLRFRCEGEGLAPGLAVTFQVEGGKATRLTVLQPGMPELVLRRTD